MTKHAEIPQIQHIDKVGDTPAVTQRQVPQVQTVPNTVAVSGDHPRSSPRPGEDGPQPSSAEEPDAAVLSTVLLVPETRAVWDSISTMTDSDEKDALRKQLCDFVQLRLAIVQASAADH